MDQGINDSANSMCDPILGKEQTFFAGDENLVACLHKIDKRSARTSGSTAQIPCAAIVMRRLQLLVFFRGYTYLQQQDIHFHMVC